MPAGLPAASEVRGGQPTRGALLGCVSRCSVVARSQRASWCRVRAVSSADLHFQRRVAPAAQYAPPYYGVRVIYQVRSVLFWAVVGES
eukprot:6739990-Lingulodinium_polyedra.AAC.1